MSDEKKDFVVKDRRIFSEENRKDEDQDKEISADTSTDDASTDSSAVGEGQANQEGDDTAAAGAQEAPPLPEINFATFIVSLNASALLHLGAIEDPVSGQTNKNLPMAKQTIDILSMLEEKTASNLTTEESNLLKNILYDLRIIYVKESG
jgi:hypothetical protein